MALTEMVMEPQLVARQLTHGAARCRRNFLRQLVRGNLDKPGWCANDNGLPAFDDASRKLAEPALGFGDREHFHALVLFVTYVWSSWTIRPAPQPSPRLRQAGQAPALRNCPYVCVRSLDMGKTQPSPARYGGQVDHATRLEDATVPGQGWNRRLPSAGRAPSSSTAIADETSP